VEAHDPRTLVLDVYETKQGLWNPDRGELELPADWEFLPVGDADVTRRVKAGGVYWNAWRPRGRNRPHRRRLGLFAPASVVGQARANAEETAHARARQRAASSRSRETAEDAYREEFRAGVVAWLAFAPQHAALAEEIAEATAERAVVVGSGRVGRTKVLPLEERVALAARATIRHRFTDYDDRLVLRDVSDTAIDDFEYRLVKQAAHDDVDDFLSMHRRRPRDTSASQSAPHACVRDASGLGTKGFEGESGVLREAAD
jgi:hypothetical protein